MSPNKNNSLENFVGRHRADFDTHEPRPDLWAALEQQLADPMTPAAPTEPVMRVVIATSQPTFQPTPPPTRGWLYQYGVAAALALLVFAAGASEAWKANRAAPTAVASVRPGASGTAGTHDDAALYLGGTTAMTAAERTTGADSQLVRAVRGMETYYAGQLARRREALRQLAGPAAAGMAVDWQRELVSLDSSYRILKQDLSHHPQPEAVLTAMNRNLQIRLDILDQQLHLGTAAEPRPSAGTYVLADSRRLPE